MKNLTLIKKIGLVSISVFALVAAGPVAAFNGQNLEKTAKVKMVQARVIALHAKPGKITSAELGVKKGNLRYAFDIKGKKGAYDVYVDAHTGKVLGLERD